MSEPYTLEELRALGEGVTPGEWTSSTQQGSASDAGCWIAQVFAGKSLAQIEPTEDEDEGTANARLMAASKRLLAQATAQAEELARLREETDGYRIALGDALPVLELLMERNMLLDRMIQPDMSGVHPLQGELDRLDGTLRRKYRGTVLYPIIKTARSALAPGPGEML